MGKNKLGELLKTMSEKAGLTGENVNHSARKTTVTPFLHFKGRGNNNYAVNWTEQCSFNTWEQFSILY